MFKFVFTCLDFCLQSPGAQRQAAAGLLAVREVGRVDTRGVLNGHHLTWGSLHKPNLWGFRA